MDKQIAVGDVVMVVRWPCCGVSLGRIFRVERFDNFGLFKCAPGGCGAVYKNDAPYAVCPNIAAAPVAWLKKLPPLTEPEETPTATPEEIAGR